MKEIVEKLTSRSFLILVVSMILFVMKMIDTEQFMTINGFNYAGSSIKMLIESIATKNNTGAVK